MPKFFAICALIVALGLLLIFGLDLAISVPFKKASTVMDVGFVICGLALAYMSWTTFREQR